MKKITALFIALVLSYPIFAQQADWKEMHSFHAIMGKSFHSAEEKNLQPLKENVTELLLRAKNWEKSTTPKGFDGKITKPILKKLVAKCEEIRNAVAAKKDDKTLTTLITEAHDVFHEIMEKCKPEAKHKH